MATLSNDGQSLLIDSKRHWIVSGTVGYAGVPRALWNRRLRGARNSGLNTIVVPAVWSHHQVNANALDFEGDRDIAAFIRGAGAVGLHVIVRVGPVVDRALDLGGMPSSLLGTLNPAEALRSDGPEFLSRVSAWIRGLCAQIATLQITEHKDGDPAGGPIIGVQAEHEFTCADPDLAQTYLGAIARYLREGSIRTPIINTNNLMVAGESEIETWSGYANLHAITRQLRVAKRNQPRIIGDLRAGTEPRWGEEASTHKTAAAVERTLVEVLAAGGQFNIGTFARGARLGFSAAEGVATSTVGCDLIDDAGRHHPSLGTVRRVCTFASSFSSVLAGLEPDFQPAIISPASVAPAVINEETGERSPGKPASSGYAVDFGRGSQGSVAFIFADDTSTARRKPAVLTLPDGTNLEVDLGKSGAAWVLLRTHLFGRATLDYCSLRPLCRFGEVFVCFGTAGSTGMISINGTAAEIAVPKGKTAHIETIEGVKVVVLSEQLADSAILDHSTGEARLLIGASAVTDEGEPIYGSGHKTVQHIAADGSSGTLPGKPALEGGAKISLASWERASEEHHAGGQADQFALIDGPTNMDALGVPSGYGWLKVDLKNVATKKTPCAMLESGDRLHLYFDDEPAVVVGDGPGATGRMVTLPLVKGEQTVGVLVDNLGRAADRSDLRRPKGLFGHIYATKAFKPGAPSVENGSPLDLMEHFRPMLHAYRGDRTSAKRLTWSFVHRRKSPLSFVLEEVSWHGALLVNDEPVLLIEPGVPVRAVLTPEMLRQGGNTVQIALLEPSETVEKSLAAIRKQASWCELATNVTEKASFSFAPWGPPDEERFEAAAKSALNGSAARKHRGRPAWWRCRFNAVRMDRPLILDVTGLSKGQVLLNGHNAGRYFVQTPDGKPVPPQKELWLPECWLNEKEQPENELLIFDESGFSPDKVKLGYAPIG